jgi:hypothetical protein
LTLPQAHELHSKRVRIRITVDASCEEIRNQDVYGCQGEDDRYCTVWFPAGQVTDEEMTVEAVFVVVRQRNFTEFRLTRARRCK